MKVREINLFIIKMPLKSPFSTSLGTVTEREGIILEVIDTEGVKGYGEVVAFSTPWYTEETVQTSYHMLRDILIPLLRKITIKHPEDVNALFDTIRGNQMAKAGLETALWDLVAKRQQLPLWKLIGGVRENILSGVVVGSQNVSIALEQINGYVEAGYERIKIKIKPGSDYKLIKEIRSAFPNLSLMADANSAYSLNDISLLQSLDEFNLQMIEQPLAVDDIVDHALLQREINTPVCLDESIVTYHDAESAIKLKSCKVINIKIGRVGGLSNAIKIHDLCLKHGIQVWCGGMLEFGVSRAHNIALATKVGFSIPGDISASSRYWEEDIITPEVKVNNGRIQAPTDAGIGFDINHKRLKQVTIYQESFKGSQ